MISEPPKIKSDTVSTVSPSICHEVMGPDAMIFGQFHKQTVVYTQWNLIRPFKVSNSDNASNEYSRLISFRIYWFDLLSVRGTLKSLLQHHKLKPSILWRSAFFMVQLSYLYMTAGKNMALTVWTFAGKVMSLLFNMLPRFVITSSRSKCLLISWLQS